MNNGRRRAGAGILAAAVALGALTAGSAAASADETAWTQVGSGITEGISGAASLKSGWVVIRDNKKAGENRVSLLSRSGQVTPLTWPVANVGDNGPVDIESVAAVPGAKDQFAVLTSKGAGTIISIDGQTITLKDTFTVPAGGGSNDIEGLVLIRKQGTTVAVWAKRGSTTTDGATTTVKPAKVFAATFNPADGTFGGSVLQGEVTVPEPVAAVVGQDIRHVTDLAIVGKRLIGPAASDQGDNGPFESVLYDLGSVGVKDGDVQLTLGAPTELGRYADHKVEAVACSDEAGGLLGTDDENLGSYITSHAFCDE